MLNAVYTLEPAQLDDFLVTWRIKLCNELRTNSTGFCSRKHPKIAQLLPLDFPNINVLRLYSHPITSENFTLSTVLGFSQDAEPDLGKLANFCERFFGWGPETDILKSFRNIIWPGVVCRRFLSANRRFNEAYGRPFSNFEEYTVTHDDNMLELALVPRIHRKREHSFTNKLLEYRMEFRPGGLAAQVRAGLTGFREADQKSKAVESPEESPMRVWVPAVMVEGLYPELVTEFKERTARKQAKDDNQMSKRVRNDLEHSDDSMPDPRSVLQESLFTHPTIQ